jgi:putative flippase GtrA
VSASANLHRWASFAGVGAIGLAVQLGALALLTEWAGLAAPVATAMAVEVTVLHNFAWHEWWTWGDRARTMPGRWPLRLARFHAASGLVSLAGNVALTLALVEWLHAPVVIANACAVMLLGLVNFVVADRFAFEP